MRDNITSLDQLDQLLADGGDSRSTILDNHLNKYRCSTSPRAAIVPLGSCTASNISEHGYGSARRQLNRLLAVGEGPDFTFAVEESYRRIRCELKFLLTRGEVGGLDVVLTPSGTDAELLPCLIASLGHRRNICNIVVGPKELGSGTSLAAACKYFDTLTPAGDEVKPGGAIAATLTDRITVSEIVVRDNEGIARPIAAIDDETRQLVQRQIEKNCDQVLLHITAHSKTGAHAPSLDLVAELKKKYPQRLDVVVDAAQGRFSRRGLIKILQDGYLVITTGSKFYGGPPFAGAVLVPAQFQDRIEHCREFPSSFSTFFTQSMFPSAWHAFRHALPEGENIGLLLRWSAAIEEIRNYYSVPSRLRLAILRKFESLLPEVFSSSAIIQLDAFSAPIVSDDYHRFLQSKQTVFPFRVWYPAEHRYFGLEELRMIFLWLGLDLSSALPKAESNERRALAVRSQLGQPVQLCNNEGGDVSVLRIANGGTLVAMIAEDTSLGQSLEHRFGWLEDQFLNIRSKLEVIAHHFQSIRAQLENGCENYERA